MKHVISLANVDQKRPTVTIDVKAKKEEAKKKVAELKGKIKELKGKLKEVNANHKEKMDKLNKAHSSSKEMKGHIAAIKQAEKDNDLRGWKAATKNHDETVKKHSSKLLPLSAKHQNACTAINRKIKEYETKINNLTSSPRALSGRRLIK